MNNDIAGKSTYALLRELSEYTSKHNHLPALEAISRLIEQFEAGALAEGDLSVAGLFAQIENLERGIVSKHDLISHFLWILEGYGGAVKNAELTRKLDEISQQLEQRDREQRKALSKPVIDFKEIPPANIGDGYQDTFEMFARDFLRALGYHIEEGPGRGADRGKDLLVLESLSGVLSNASRRWLVSCKHFAHSGKAVGAQETDIYDRVRQFECRGFMAFYSTLPTSTLNEKLSSVASKGIDIEVLDRTTIEHLLLSDERLQDVMARYFPRSRKAKQRLEMEHSYQQKILVIDHELKSKVEEAVVRRDARSLINARREHARKMELAQQQRDLDLTHLDGIDDHT